MLCWWYLTTPVLLAQGACCCGTATVKVKATIDSVISEGVRPSCRTGLTVLDLLLQSSKRIEPHYIWDTKQPGFACEQRLEAPSEQDRGEIENIRVFVAKASSTLAC